ncbi:mitochondrial PGP phosphatase-domain-containing protein [Russula earlei]|uniref:Mitochondrial PGP phosphatase-domain-containing protein n=1 Tax=Russula earlei TaxID=71964 RepID=A0ACC0UIL1_9AGAM|nr:mitochondrial PGP phosphatase-domain-containing protein [Russula earlei]
MPFNLPATLVPLYALLNPRLLLPSITVVRLLLSISSKEISSSQPDIRSLNFAALRDAGYRGAIFDKDNCLTLPHSDNLIPELEAAWSEALRAFGPSHILVVSNSAGTRDDAAQLQAESVAYHLRAPVLLHTALKPSYSCAAAALAALPGLAPHELVVVGDRIFTDVVIAHRLSHPRTVLSRVAARLGLAPAHRSAFDDTASGDNLVGKLSHAPMAVWTTSLWARESVAMRWAEARLVRLIERCVEGARERRVALEEQFVRFALDNENSKGKAGRGWFSWVKALPKLR